MNTEERLIRYCKIDTQSDPYSDTVPSTQKQFDLARLLVNELKKMGIADAVLDENCYVYAHLESNTDTSCDTVGFVAHMDTSPDYFAANVNPQVIRNYNGEDIVLGGDVVMHTDEFPRLKTLKGKTLVVTDGSTLLGADDKAGIAAIMEGLSYLIKHPEIKHGRIAVAFTPDEEVGSGTAHFDTEKFGADFAYTLDGGDITEWSDETFNAAGAVVNIQGVSIHLGDAKNKMINALNLAMEFHQKLPEHMRPEHTEKKEPFFHLHHLEGNGDHAKMEYLIRAHDRNDFEKMQEMMKKAAEYVNFSCGKHAVDVEIDVTYYNMKEVLRENPKASLTAEKAMRSIGIEPVNLPIRGGTDGASLTFMGVPCPNLGTGGGNCHSRYEYCVVEEMEQAAQLMVEIVQTVQKEMI